MSTTTQHDWMDEAEAAERAEAWPQALALWQRAVQFDGPPDTAARCDVGIRTCQEQVRVDAELEAVAKRILHIPTLETRKSDSLDFHEVSVWQLLAALRLVYRMGRREP